MKYKYKLLALGFLLIIFVFGTASDINLIRFHVSKEVVNEEWTPELGRKNETEYATVFYAKDAFLDMNGGVRKTLGQRQMNGVVRLMNGQLTEEGMPAIRKKKLRREAGSVASLHAYLETEGIPFLYVIAPDKISPFDGTYDDAGLLTGKAKCPDPENTVCPVGFEDHVNQNIDVFRTALDAWGVPYIDLREEMLRDGIDWYSYFYRTDHHWTSEAGWYAYGKIADWTEENTDILLDKRARDGANYEKQTCHNCMLGSWGQRTGKRFAGTDDVTLYIPVYQTDFENLTFQKRGRMEDVIYNREYLDEKNPGMIYDPVFDSLDQIVNHSADNDTTIMIITDSYSRVVCPFISLSVRNMWFNSSYKTDQINAKLIEKLQPDMVICLQSPRNSLGEDACFAYDLNR